MRCLYRGNGEAYDRLSCCHGLQHGDALYRGSYRA